jgi:hypothetical protein
VTLCFFLSDDQWKWVPEHEPPKYTFPENDLLYDLVKLYFTEFAPFTFPLIHRPTFESSISTGYHLIDPSFGALVLAVCALGSRHSKDPRNHINNTDYNHLVGWKYFRQIQLIRPTFEKTTSLYELQLYCVGIFFDPCYPTNSFIACMPLLGINHHCRLLLALDWIRGPPFTRKRSTSLPSSCKDARK